MSITRIEVSMGEGTVTFTASAKGIVVSPFEQIIDPTSRYVFAELLDMFRMLHHPEDILVSMFCFDTPIFSKRYTFDHIVTLRRAEEAKDRDTLIISTIYDWDDISDVYLWLFISFDKAFDRMKHTCSWLRKKEMIQGKECPVLLIPLTDSCVLLKKCNHHISHEAWLKLENTNGERKCPLCRATHRSSEVEQ